MNPNQSQERIIKADKKARKLVLVAYIVAAALVMLLVMYILPRGQAQLEDVEPEVVLRVIQIIIGFIFLSVIPFGVYLCRLGRRAITHRQMPPPGTKVIVDTKVLEGDKAVTRGRLMIAMGLALIALALIGGLYLPYKIGKAFGQQIHPPAPQAEQPETRRVGQALPYRSE